MFSLFIDPVYLIDIQLYKYDEIIIIIIIIYYFIACTRIMLAMHDKIVRYCQSVVAMFV